jgi:hypothetical protein
VDRRLCRPVYLRSEPERVRKVGNTHRTRDPSSVIGTGADVGRATRGDEVGRVEMASVGRLTDEERDVHTLG